MFTFMGDIKKMSFFSFLSMILIIYQEKYHIDACNEYQEMERTRIQFMRNSIWTFSNVVSDFCCLLDDSREKIRLVAENCDEDADIQELVLRHGTCSSPLSPVLYEAADNSESADETLPVNQINVSYDGNFSPSSEVLSDVCDENPYSEVETFVAQYDYSPQSDDEIPMTTGDSLRAIERVEQGWIKVLNLSTNLTGLVPESYLQKNR